MTTHKMIIAGFGGQGVMLMGQMIAYAGLLEGKEVTWMPSYGPEMRGGTANCTVVVSERKVASPVAAAATAVVAMNGPSLMKFQDLLIPGGHLFINTSLITEQSRRQDIEIHSVSCNDLAIGLQNDRAANMVMLGAVIYETHIVSRRSVEKVIEKIFIGAKQSLQSVNKQALILWEQEIGKDLDNYEAKI